MSPPADRGQISAQGLSHHPRNRPVTFGRMFPQSVEQFDRHVGDDPWAGVAVDVFLLLGHHTVLLHPS